MSTQQNESRHAHALAVAGDVYCVACDIWIERSLVSAVMSALLNGNDVRAY